MAAITWNMQGRNEVATIRALLSTVGDKGILCLQETANLRVTEGAGMKF